MTINMAPIQTVILVERPKTDIEPGRTFKLQPENKLSKDDLNIGQALVHETRYLSLDPAMRFWLNEASSYTPSIPVGGVMGGAFIARFVTSRYERFVVGGYVYADCGWREEAVVKEKDGDVKVLDEFVGGEVDRCYGCSWYVIITVRDLI